MASPMHEHHHQHSASVHRHEEHEHGHEEHLQKTPEEHEGHGGNDLHDHAHMGSHSMSFHAGTEATILFEFWHCESVLALTISCLLIFVVAVMYEALKYYREWLFRNRARRSSGGALEPPTVEAWSFKRSSHTRSISSSPPQPHPQRESTPQLSVIPARAPGGNRHLHHGIPQDTKLGWLAPLHLYQTFLHMLQVTISFLLMLVFMTFNVWLCLAVVLGAGVGYFMFGHRTLSLQEHCN
ncbi:probable low affinity copper uptake protein 2 [Scaptodrosophila lebanonensis]|uniref:Copper transport protein n=1 Tax=Drosophila lebanonensis TaxID=7225 RepID=A0A6J2T788_DROLE|nr:probable low affinity copper uptake protein 2 [Scaptodrosophila lebanonensis]